MPEASVKNLSAKVSSIMSLWTNSRPGRVLARYGNEKGYLLAGGIAYTTMFSLFAALAIGWTVFSSVLGANPQLRSQVISSINQALPGILKTEDSPGLVDPNNLLLSVNLNVAGIIAILVLILAALRVMDALKASIRAMFGLHVLPENIFFSKLRDLLGFVIITLGVLATSALGLAGSHTGRALLSYFSVSGTAASFTLRVLALLSAAVVDFFVIIAMIRFHAGVRPPRKQFLIGSAAGAVGFGVLRFLGTAAISVTSNPLIAGFAALIALLLWINLVVQFLLFIAAWIANPPAPKMPEDPSFMRAGQTPNFVTLSAPHTLRWPHLALTGALDVAVNPPKENAKTTPYWGGFARRYLNWRKDGLQRKLARVQKNLDRPAKEQRI